MDRDFNKNHQIQTRTLVLDILDSYNGEELTTSEVLRALASVSRTDLVHVKTKDEEVRVWIW